MAKSPAAKRIRCGTSTRNVSSPVLRSKIPPATPPSAPVIPKTCSLRASPLKSLNCASAPPRYPGQRATVLVTLATTTGTPTARSTGKVMSVPPPAKAFTAPASIAATKTAISSTSVISLFLCAKASRNFAATERQPRGLTTRVVDTQACRRVAGSMPPYRQDDRRGPGQNQRQAWPRAQRSRLRPRGCSIAVGTACRA